MVKLHPAGDEDVSPVVGLGGDFENQAYWSMSSSGFDANDWSMMNDSFNDWEET